MIEVWVAIEGFDGYEVSNAGNVRSWLSKNGRGRARSPHALAALPFADSEYLRVSLRSGGVAFTKRVHRLVLEAFVGPCPEGLEGCHGDGNAANNRIENLRWGTKNSNAQDRIDHGRQVRGEAVGISALTDAQVAEIRERIAAGQWRRGDGRHYSRKFGVGDSAISSVKHNQTWSHI